MKLRGFDIIGLFTYNRAYPHVPARVNMPETKGNLKKFQKLGQLLTPSSCLPPKHLEFILSRTSYTLEATSS